jgi:CheY-like chemotaxis protein
VTSNPREVVVCDADSISLRLLARTMTRNGYTVTTAGTAAAAEAAVEEHEPELALLAILLPDLDGLQLTRKLRVRCPKLTIVVVSALPAEQRALDAGADAFLLKPVQPSRLIATVQQHYVHGSGA